MVHGFAMDSAFLILLVGTEQAVTDTPYPLDRAPVAVFVSSDVPLDDSLHIQRILRSHGVWFSAKRLSVRTDRTRVFAADIGGPAAHAISGWLGGAPIVPFDWPSGFEIVIYVAHEKASGTGVRAADGRGRAARTAPPERTRPRPSAHERKPDDSNSTAFGPLAASVESPLATGGMLDTQPTGWVKLYGQPPEIAPAEVASRSRLSRRPSGRRKRALPGKEGLRMSVMASALFPSGRTGNLFTVMPGAVLTGGYSWSPPWVVQASVSFYRAAASVRSEDNKTPTGAVTLVPVVVSVLLDFRPDRRLQPYIGAGAEAAIERVSSLSVFGDPQSGGATGWGLGYELKGGGRFRARGRWKVDAEAGIQFARADVGGHRDGAGGRFSLGLGF